MLDFKVIDAIINDFVSDKQFITVSRDAKSDWFKFEYRRIEWTSSGLSNLIEIFPTLEPSGSYNVWNLSCVSWYDDDNKRFHKRVMQLKEVSFEELENNVEQKLNDAFAKMSSTHKEEIIEFIKLESLS
jgi:hypothetical protein